MFGVFFNFIIDIGVKMLNNVQSFFAFLSTEFSVGGVVFTVVDLLFGIGLVACLTWAIVKFLLPT